MQFTANEINFLLDGELIGNPEVKVSQLAKIEEAKEGSLSFLANPKYEAFLYTTQASVVIVKPGGTGNPIWTISARFAPLPPSKSDLLLSPNVNG